MLYVMSDNKKKKKKKKKKNYFAKSTLLAPAATILFSISFDYIKDLSKTFEVQFMKRSNVGEYARNETYYPIQMSGQNNYRCERYITGTIVLKKMPIKCFFFICLFYSHSQTNNQ